MTADLRGGRDWKMIGPPQYVIDRAQDFIDAGVDEFTFNMIPNDPEVYAELNETVLSAFDRSSVSGGRQHLRVIRRLPRRPSGAPECPAAG